MGSSVFFRTFVHASANPKLQCLVGAVWDVESEDNEDIFFQDHQSIFSNGPITSGKIFFLYTQY